MTTTQETFQVALGFEDGVTRFITCRGDQTVADASYRQRINIPLDCRDGACGTCKAKCESGDYDPGFYIDDALTEDEAQQGYCLPCQMKPNSDLVLEIASTSQVAKTAAATYHGTVTGIDRLSPTTVELSVEIADRDKLGFLPGQYVNIAVPGTDQTRSYSFSNHPEDQTLTFLVKLTPGGAMSEWLDKQAKVGDDITFAGPNGSFFLRETERPMMLLAGGTGLAPVLAILRTLHRTNADRQVHLFYGVTTEDDLVKLPELERIAGEMPNLTWDYTVSRPVGEVRNQGYVQSLITEDELHDGDVAIYLCGPPPMVEAVRVDLSERGVEPAGFYYEKFALANQPGAALTAGAAEVDVKATGAPEDEEETAPQAVVAAVINGSENTLLPLRAGDGQMVAGQRLFHGDALSSLEGERPSDLADVGDMRRIVGQDLAPADLVTGAGAALDDDEPLVVAVEARNIGPQELFWADDVPSLLAPTRPLVSEDGYQIGEDHPSIQQSDALFEARTALEVGAARLVIGKLSSSQLSGYRLLAEDTLRYVDSEQESFTEPAAYAESNEAFHEYLVAQCGNTHLLQAFQALGVKGHMVETLSTATWCHPDCATDHVAIVEAFADGDGERAVDLMHVHAEHSKETTRRAMAESIKEKAEQSTPRFITPGRFTNQVVAVTGAAQGIGAQVARRIAAEGGQLVLADRSSLVNELLDELTATGQAQAIAVECDLENGEGARALAQAAREKFGRIDVLVNNVGGAINFKPFVEFTDEEIQAEVTRSLMTTLYACRAVLPGMVEAGRGVILNVSSAATRGINRIPYSAAKGGINAITASLAMEYADAGVRVVATAPGGTEAPPRRISRGTPEPRNQTEQAWFQAHIDQTLDSSLMHRYGTLDEQAAAICFLASPEAAYITGTVLPVAGGDLG